MPVSRLVVVERLPEVTSEDQAQRFLGKMQRLMSDRRPRVVLDCSGLSQTDKPVLNLLLSCLEEAMKRNGDARLSFVSPSAQAELKSIGADRLFQVFASNAEAVNSFHQNSLTPNAIESAKDEDGQIAENAA